MNRDEGEPGKSDGCWLFAGLAGASALFTVLTVLGELSSYSGREDRQKFLDRIIPYRTHTPVPSPTPEPFYTFQTYFTSFLDEQHRGIFVIIVTVAGVLVIAAVVNFLRNRAMIKSDV